MELIIVPAISTVVYWTMNIFKILLCGKIRFKRYIPLLSAVFGAVLGCAVYFIENTQTACASNFLTALIIGGVSGLSATGAHQMIKQLRCGDKEDDCK